MYMQKLTEEEQRGKLREQRAAQKVSTRHVQDHLSIHEGSNHKSQSMLGSIAEGKTQQ